MGGIVGLTELVVDVGDHIEAHVEADEVAELERPDGETYTPSCREGVYSRKLESFKARIEPGCREPRRIGRAGLYVGGG